MKILIVEDEEAIAHGLQFNFLQEGYDVVVADDGAKALYELEHADPPVDLVVLDLMLPGMSGYDVCRAIRERDDRLPILILSARTLAEDKMQAFDLGSDQYMTKPFALPELLARVRNLLARRRRSGDMQTAASGDTQKPPSQFRFANVKIDFDKFEVEADGLVHQLTTREAELLRFFVTHEGIVLSRQQILRDVWDEQAEITTRSIDNFVLRLRRILEANPAEPRHILSIRGTGYRFVADPNDASHSSE